MRKKNFNNFKSLRDFFLFYCVYVMEMSPISPYDTFIKKNLLLLLELCLRARNYKVSKTDIRGK